MNPTGYEDWALDDLKAFITSEQDRQRVMRDSLRAASFTLRMALWELEKRLRKAV